MKGREGVGGSGVWGGGWAESRVTVSDVCCVAWGCYAAIEQNHKHLPAA